MKPDLDAIRARCEAASGPAWTWETDDWTTTRRSSVSRIISMDAIRARQESGIETSARLPYLATVYGDADTAFIVHARTDIPALLAYIDELERRTAYTTGETKVAHRIATLEHMLAEERENVDTLRARVAELEAEVAVLRPWAVMLKRAHGALTDAGCVVPLEFDQSIEHAINDLARRATRAEQLFVDEYDARKAAEREIAELKARITTLEAMKP